MAVVNVFLSWSGSRSRIVAEVLRDWLPKVHQLVHPWISVDIEKGARWDGEIAARLDECRIGILCLTAENMREPWLLFEAGAISRTKDARACTYLFELKPSDLLGSPLASFQHTRADDKEDTRRLIRTINNSLGSEKLGERQLDASFDKWWPDLEAALSEIPPVTDLNPDPKARERAKKPLDLITSKQLESPQEDRLVVSDGVSRSLSRIGKAIYAWLESNFADAEIQPRVVIPVGDLRVDIAYYLRKPDNISIAVEWKRIRDPMEVYSAYEDVVKTADSLLVEEMVDEFLVFIISVDELSAPEIGDLIAHRPFKLHPNITTMVGYLGRDDGLRIIAEHGGLRARHIASSP
ncbi:MAG: TIR domain-containing protein [Anaerolineae bacterium]